MADYIQIEFFIYSLSVLMQKVGHASGVTYYFR